MGFLSRLKEVPIAGLELTISGLLMQILCCSCALSTELTWLLKMTHCFFHDELVINVFLIVYCFGKNKNCSFHIFNMFWANSNVFEKKKKIKNLENILEKIRINL